MNKTLLYLTMPLVAIAVIAGCRHDVTCGFAGWDRAARQDMRDVIVLSDLSNADKGNAILSLAGRYAETALSMSDSIAQLLPERSRRLFKNERQAYERWRTWQETVYLELIGDIWDLWYGGSALGSFQTLHIYRIEDRNLEDNLELCRLLCGESAQEDIVEDVSLFQLKEEADLLLNEVTDKEYQDKMAQTISIDLGILREWLSTREEFSKSLPWRVRREYDKQTNAWLLLCRSQYDRRFCYETK